MAIGKGRMWPGIGNWKAASLGNTRGGIVTAVTAARKEEKVDQYGETTVNRWGFGLPKVSCDMTLAEMTAARMAVVTGETMVGTTVKIKGTTGIGSNDVALAGVLKMFPIINGAASVTPQVTMPLAYPMFDLAFAFGETAQGMKTIWGGFPDEADGNTVFQFDEL